MSETGETRWPLSGLLSFLRDGGAREPVKAAYQQVLDAGVPFRLPIQTTRGLHGNRFYYRLQDGMVQHVEEGDYVIQFADGQIMHCSPAVMEFLIDMALGVRPWEPGETFP